MFFPYVGLVLAVVWMGFILLEGYLNSIVFDSGKKTFIALGLILFVGLYAHATYQRNEVWHSEESLWKDVTEKSPNNARGLMNYGLVLMGRGYYAGAETYFLRGLQLWPNYSYLYVNMGIVKNAMGKTAEAEGYFRKGVELGSSVPKNYFFYARFLNQIGKKEEAIDNLKICLSKTSADLNARNLLMEILSERKRNEELRQVAQQTLQIDPSNVAAARFLQIASGKSQTDIIKEEAAKKPTPEAYLNLSLSYYQAGKFEDCINAAEKALKLNPNFPEALNNICSAYNSLGRFAEGAKACEQAIKLRPDYPLAKNNLAWAKSNIK
jgi:tetratricopeptide (TPR) repeat protein